MLPRETLFGRKMKKRKQKARKEGKKEGERGEKKGKRKYEPSLCCLQKLKFIIDKLNFRSEG